MFRNIAIFILSILLLVLLPVLLLVFSPILLYRCLVIRLSKWFRPTFDQILDPFSSIFANVDLYREPVLGVTGVLVFNGRLELDQVCEAFQERILNLRNPVDGELVYAKMTQKITKWLGYYFWESEEDVDVRAHFYVHNEAEPGRDSAVVTQEDFQKIVEGILNRPFPAEQSPWQIILIHNARLASDPPGVGNKTVVVIYCHHALSGGGSSIDFVRAFCADPTFQQINPIGNNNNTNEGTLDKKTMIWKSALKFALTLKLVFFGPYELLTQLVEAKDNNAWTCVKTAEWTGKYNTDTSEPIPLKVIKAIKNLHKTSFMAVVLAAYAGGIRAFMTNNSIPVPNSIHCMIPVQFKTVNKDGLQLGNFFSNAMVRLPLDVQDAQSRLIAIEKTLRKLRYSSIFSVNKFLQNLIGRLPTVFMSRSPITLGNTVLLTNVPGPPEKVLLCNTDAVALMSYLKLSPGLGIGTMVISYNDHLRFILGADQSVVPLSQPMKDLNTFIAEELSDLLKLEIV